MAPSSKSSSSSPSKSKSSSKSTSSKPSSSKKASKHDPDSDDERPSSSRKSSSKPSSSSSSTKKLDKKEKTSLLQSMFTKDRPEAPKFLESKYFKDESSKPSKSERLDSAMFRDESRVMKEKSEEVKSEVKVESVKCKNEKKKIEEVEEEYTEEPDFSEFVSRYTAPEEVMTKVETKQEKKVEKSMKPEVYKSEVVKSRYESVKAEASTKYEDAKVESRVKSVANFKTTFTDNHDIEMAAKQTQIAELTGQELEEQEKWALEKLKAHAGSCPAGFAWIRYTEEACGEQVRLEGYRCMGKLHFVTDEMIASGEGEALQKTTAFMIWGMMGGERSMAGPPDEMPPPFTGLRWTSPENIHDRFVPKDDAAQQLDPFGSSVLAGGRGMGRGLGGMGKSSYDPFGRYNSPSGSGNSLWPQPHSQPGGRRRSTLDPNDYPDDEDDKRRSGRRDPFRGGGPFGGGYNGGGYNGGGGSRNGWI
ncbi:hypothetical protein BKA64DRAFT_750617 [Cadophora sp. MPI-SDFR-AT-0126]|nr:hypothetical protein BKA64DRAFT_750617 [Leotiomycetes sp. MPI-SDFR-AT-0126]